MGLLLPPYSYYLCRAPDIAAVGTIFNVFSYDAVLVEIRTYHLPDDERLHYVLSPDRVSPLLYNSLYPVIRPFFCVSQFIDVVILVL